MLFGQFLTKIGQKNVGEIAELPVRIFRQIGLDHFRIVGVSHGLPERNLDARIVFASSTIFKSSTGQFGKLPCREALQVEDIQ